jgi:hypothetical protein
MRTQDARERLARHGRQLPVGRSDVIESVLVLRIDPGDL